MAVSAGGSVCGLDLGTVSLVTERRFVRGGMADGIAAPGIVYRFSGDVLYTSAGIVVGQGGSDAVFRSRTVCIASDCKYFFGSGHQDHCTF